MKPSEQCKKAGLTNLKELTEMQEKRRETIINWHRHAPKLFELLVLGAAKKSVINKNIESLRGVTETQCSEGNWNHDPYMHGMANGMILALAIMTDEEPKFIEAPKSWLSGTSGGKNEVPKGFI